MYVSVAPLPPNATKKQVWMRKYFWPYFIVLLVIVISVGAAIAMARVMDDAKSQHAPSSTVQCFHDN